MPTSFVPFFCTQCRQMLTDLDSVFTVEGRRPRSFCSEKCVQTFYGPVMDYFQDLEFKLREKCQADEPDLELPDEYLDQALESPDEVWRLDRDIDEDIFFALKKTQEKELWVVVVCLFNDNQPSVVLSHLATKNPALVDHFRLGQRQQLAPSVEQEEDQGAAETVELDPDSLQTLEQKKSALLADLLEGRNDADIAMESFPLYEQYRKETLENPEESYSFQDDAGDELLTFIRSFQRGGKSFFYVVVCQEYQRSSEQRSSEQEEQILLPIIAFPTVDGELYHRFKKGEKIDGPLKN